MGGTSYLYLVDGRHREDRKEKKRKKGGNGKESFFKDLKVSSQ